MRRTQNFYPRPPRGGRQIVSALVFTCNVISIHALREEGDFAAQLAASQAAQFLSTPSARRATHAGVLRVLLQQISIHALREEGDDCLCHAGAGGLISIHALREEGDYPSKILRFCFRYFYPRPPRGGRPVKPLLALHIALFLSTPSARRATIACAMPEPEVLFLSTPSARRATIPPKFYVFVSDISIHALREEGDRLNLCWLCILLYFYPRPPRGGRQQKQRQNLYFLINYTTFCTNLEEP